MMLAAIEIPMLSEVVIILGLATFVIVLFRKFKLPTIIGYLLTGIIAGPTGFNLVGSSDEFDALSEIGIILLLFVIGMEFSLKNLAAIKNIVLIGGGIQVLLTIAVVTGLTVLLGFELNTAIFIGFLFSLSSTAIVLKLLQEQAEINSPHGKIALGILIFQDIVIVPLMLFTPILAGVAENVWLELGMLTLKGVLVIAAVIFSAKKLFPWILDQIAKTKSQELFILSTVGICFAVAYGTSELGLSLGLGAFLAGLIISESEYSHQATSNILPFRELFISFFFVSIGIIFDGMFMLQNLPFVIALTVGTFIIKGAVAAFAARVLGYPLRTALLAGLCLFQVGEFSLLLSKSGLDYELLTPEVYQYFLSVSIFTMAITPFVLMKLDKISYFIMRSRLLKKMNRPLDNVGKKAREIEKPAEVLDDHLIIIGYGLNGRNLSRAAKSAGIKYVIVELNAETVKEESKKGEPIHFGDAVSGHVLHHIHAEKARVAVVAISDPVSTKRIVQQLRSINPSLHLIVRTRFVAEMEENYKLGANAVIPEEFETSIEIFTRVLNKYFIPNASINEFIQKIRSANYEMLRDIPGAGGLDRISAQIPEMNVTAIRVLKGKNEVVGKTMKEAQVRNKYHVTIIALKRDTETITELGGETLIKCDDILYVMGRPQNIEDFSKVVAGVER